MAAMWALVADGGVSQLTMSSGVAQLDYLLKDRWF